MQQQRNKCGDHIPAFLCPEIGTCFDKIIPAAGHFHMRPLQLDKDLLLLHEWVNMEYARYWQLQNSTIQKVTEMYTDLVKAPYVQPFMGFYNDQPAFLAEFYHAAEDRIGKYYDAAPGDYGFHILLSPPGKPIPNFSWNVFRVIIDFLFNDKRVERLIVEPDATNEKIHMLNKRAGFEYQQFITLPEKTAHLAFCTREQYHTALKHETLTSTI